MNRRRARGQAKPDIPGDALLPPLYTQDADLNITVRSGASQAALWILMTLININAAFPIEWVYCVLHLTPKTSTEINRKSQYSFLLFASTTVAFDFLVHRNLTRTQIATLATTLIQMILVSKFMHQLGLLKPSIESTMGSILAVFFVALRFTIWDVSPLHGMAVTWEIPAPNPAGHTISLKFASAPLNKTAATIISPFATTSDATTSLLANLASSVWTTHLEPGLGIHCAAFCLVYILYKASGLVSTEFDSVCRFFGRVDPKSPQILVERVMTTSIRVSWGSGGNGGGRKRRNGEDAGVVGGVGEKGVTWLGIFGDGAEKEVGEKVGGSVGSGILATSQYEKRKERVGTVGKKAVTSSAAEQSSDAEDTETVGVLAEIEAGMNVAPARKFEIELNGEIVAETSRLETCVEIKNLQPDTEYKIRVWAIGAKNMRAVSKAVVVQTCEMKGSAEELSESEILAQITSTQNLITTTRQSLVDLHHQTQTTRTDHTTRMEVLESQLDATKAEKKSLDPHRAALKLELKRLECEKRAVESRRVKTDHALNAAKTGLELTLQEVEAVKREAEQVRADIKRCEAKTRAEEETFDKKKKDLDEQVGKLKAELKGLDGMRAKAKKVEEQVRNQIRIKQAVVEGIERDTVLGFGQLHGEEFEERKKVLEEEMKVWNEIHEKLSSEHARLKAELREEKRVKDVLVHELSRSRVSIDGDNSVGGRVSNPNQKIRLLQSPDPVFTEPRTLPPPQRIMRNPPGLESVQRLSTFDLMNSKQIHPGKTDEDEIGRAVANSLMGEINAFTV
ncbi:hypothetical protein HDU98_007919 [Podochytrium sp. JEL0797]|nr:hypothetical protein HDU98_007919 [Podochytrium sp. JEL0797]